MIISKQLQCSIQEVQATIEKEREREREGGRERERERDPDLRKKYKDAINNYIEKVYAKKLRREEACKVSKRT